MKARPVLRIDKRTGQVLERFHSLYAAQDTERGKISVSNQCNGRLLGKERHCYRYEQDFDPDEDWSGKRNVPVWVVDLDTGAVFWAPNQVVAAQALRVSKQAVLDAVERGYAIRKRYKVKLQRRFGEEPPTERREREVPQG